MSKNKIIMLASNSNRAGKTTFSKYLEDFYTFKGYKVFKNSFANKLKEEFLKKYNKKFDDLKDTTYEAQAREDIFKLSKEIKKENGIYYFSNEIKRDILNSFFLKTDRKSVYIIDDLRFLNELKLIKDLSKKYNFELILYYITLNNMNRYIDIVDYRFLKKRLLKDI